MQCTGTLNFVLPLFLFTSHIRYLSSQLILHCEFDNFFCKIGQSRDTLVQTKLICRLKRTGGSTCETAANEVITLGIMLVHIVLHVHPMPVIQEFELIVLNSFMHGQISCKHARFHYISYILQLKRGALEV